MTAKFLIVEQGSAHVAHAHEGGAPFAVGVEAGLDDLQKIRDIIAYAANAKFAEVGEILTNLRGVDVARPGKGFGRNDLNAILVHGFENLEIGGETLDGCARDMFVFRSLVHRLGWPVKRIGAERNISFPPDKCNYIFTKSRMSATRRA